MIETIINNINYIASLLIILFFLIAFGIFAICWHLYDIKDILKDNRKLLKSIKKNTSTYTDF